VRDLLLRAREKKKGPNLEIKAKEEKNGWKPRPGRTKVSAGVGDRPNATLVGGIVSRFARRASIGRKEGRRQALKALAEHAKKRTRDETGNNIGGPAFERGIR